MMGAQTQHSCTANAEIKNSGEKIGKMVMISRAE